MNQLKVGAVLNYVVLLLHSLVGLLYTPFMLRCLGQSEYGLYSLVSSVVAYLTVLDLGLGNALVRYTSKYRAEDKTDEQYEMFGMFFILHLFTGLLAMIVGSSLYFNVDNMFGDTMTILELDRARIMMILLVFNMVITFPMSIFGSIITAYEKFVFQKLVNIGRIILNTVVMVVLLTIGYKAVVMVLVATIFNIVTLLLNFLYCKRKLHISLYFRKFDWKFLKEIAIYSFWILLNVLMDRIYWSTGQFVIGAFVGTVAVSVFAVAIHLESLYLQFSTAVVSVFLPKVTKMVTSGTDESQISSLFIRTGRVQFIIVGMILSSFVVFGRHFIVLWAGPDYIEAYLMTLLFYGALLTPLIQNLGITILQARNQMKFRSLCYIVIALCSLLLQVFLAPKFGGLGCAFAISVALFIGQGIIMNIYYYKKQHLDIPRFWGEIFKMSIAPIIVTVCGVLVSQYLDCSSWIKIAFWGATYFFIYFVLLWVFSLNRSEKELVLYPLRHLKFISNS